MQSRINRAWQEWIGHPKTNEVPLPSPSLELAAKLALDEGLLWAMSKATPQSSSPQDLASADRDLDRSLRFFEDMGWIDSPSEFHRKPPRLKQPDFTRAWRGTLRYEHMRFASGYAPHDDDPLREEWMSNKQNLTAHAWVLRHRNGVHPWIVCLHGYGMGSVWTDLAAFRAEYLHRQLGMNVINYVAPLHGLRANAGAHGGEFFDGSPSSPVHGNAQAIWDLRRILGWIRSHGPTRIGVHGISLGGSTAALLANYDADLDCVIAGIPAIRIDELFRHHTKKEQQPSDDFWERLGRLQSVISPLSQPSAVDRERLFIYAGVVDRLVPAKLPNDLWNHWGEPEMLWYHGSHVTSTMDTSVKSFLDRAFIATQLATRSH